MATSATSKSKSDLPKDSAKGKRFGIVVSRYHESLTAKLLDGALSTLEKFGAAESDITTVWVPGSFEIPLAARALTALSPDAIICLGIIVQGETQHHEYIAREVSRGVAQLGLTTGIPVLFGLLTTKTIEQAKERTGGAKGHKGIEAAEAAISMICLLEDIKKNPAKKSTNVGF